MKTIPEFLRDNDEFLHFVLFQGRYGGAYGLILPNDTAERIREHLYDGGTDDYEMVIKLERLLVENDYYPGARSEDINEIISIVTDRLNKTDCHSIVTYIDEKVLPILP